MGELKSIEGVTEAQVDRYGQPFLELARKYSDEKECNLHGSMGSSSPPLQPPPPAVAAGASKTHSSHFKRSEWVVEVLSDDDDSSANGDGFIDDAGEEDEYGDEWLEEDFDAVASEHFNSNGRVVTQTTSSPKRAVSAKKLNPQQLALKAAFESQASPHAMAREPATRVGARLSKSGARRSSGGGRRGMDAGSGKAAGGGKKRVAERRGSGPAEGRRPKTFPAAPMAPPGGTKGKSAAGGGGAIRPMGFNFPRG